MNRFFHLIIRLALIFTVVFIAVQTFNGFCKLTQKCSPFYFSYYLHGEEGGDQYKIVFGTNNPSPNLQFEVIEPNITTVANRNNVATYRVKNISNHAMNFRTKLHVDPEKAKNILMIYQCLCDSRYKLEAGEERVLKMKFRLKDSKRKSSRVSIGQIFQKNNSGNFSGSQNRGVGNVIESSQQQLRLKEDNARRIEEMESKDVPVIKIVYEVW